LAGAFGVDLDSPRDGVAGIRYGAQRLDGPGAALVIFPQGAERPAHEPLVFLPGAARIAHMADAAVVPLGLRYVFADTPRPRVLASLGPPMSAEPDRKHAVALQQDAVRAQLQRIEDYLSGADHRFEAIHESSAGWVDRLMTGALDRLAAFVVPISAEQQSALAQSQGAFPPAHTGRAEGTDERDE
jgi:1-acyl-sn-glycerol-3-phosphate acyltransferase